MDYNIQKTDEGLEIWATLRLSHYIERTLQNSFLIDFISIDVKVDGLLSSGHSYVYIDINNPIITKDCLIAYLEKIITDCVYLEKCFKLECVSNNMEDI